jgi:hypothetical protein
MRALSYNLHMPCRCVSTIALAVLVFTLPGWLIAQTPQLAGKVIDENGVAVPGAKLTLSGKDIPNPVSATTDEAGRYLLPPVPPGTYELTVAKPGFYVYVSHSFELKEETGPIEVVLNHQQEFEETVNVVYSPPVIDTQQTAAEKTIQAEQIVDMPYPATHDFRSALPLLPGVVKDNAGRIHVNGGDENQTYYTLDGFNIANPVSGVLDNRLSVDAIRAIQVETSRYSAEYGKGSAGVMALETFQGDDHYRFMATNFLPSFETQEGLHISGWTPRATFSGPISKGRAWFHNATDLQYDLNVVRELPPEADRNTNWNGGNLTRFQLNLTPKNILTAGFLYNFTNSGNFGLSPYDPIETTRDIHSRSYFFNIKDQLYLKQGWILELGVGLNRLNSRELPLGSDTYVISPETRSGNYLLTSDQHVQRLQFLADIVSRPLYWHGRHELKFGIDTDGIRYRQFSLRGPAEILREDGTRARLITFSGNPSFGRDSSEFSAYVQDRWAPTEQLVFETGIRLDWDQILRDRLISPRFAFTYAPLRVRESKFSAGVGVFYDATNLDLLTRGLDQVRSDTFYSKDGSTIAAGPVVSRYLVDETTLKAPLYLNWSLGWEQKLPGAVYFNTNFIRKAGRNGWAYDLGGPGIQPGPGTITYKLTNERRDSYSYLEFTAKRMFKQKYSCMISYARSSARSTAVVDFSLENTVFSRQAGGPLPWDTPNRLISWGILPMPHFRKFSIAYFLEWHSGLPYTVVNEDQQVIGTPNSHRFPDYLSLNVHVERRFRFWRYEWAVRAGFNNITGRDNPTVVNNNIDSLLFGQFAGTQARTFTGRIRFLGKS